MTTSIDHFSTPRRRAPGRLRATMAACAFGALVLAACGDGDDTAVAGSDGIAIDGAWARTSPNSAVTGAAYLTITADADDALLGASVDDSIAGTVEIHETAMVDPDDMASEDDMGEDDMGEDDMGEDDMASEDDMGEVMQMRQIQRLELPAGKSVALEPGGFHVMMLDLPAPLEAGDTFELTLDFETAPDQVITVEVRSDAPAS